MHNEESAVVLVQVHWGGGCPFDTNSYLALAWGDGWDLSYLESGAGGDGYYCCVGCHFFWWGLIGWNEVERGVEQRLMILDFDDAMEFDWLNRGRMGCGIKITDIRDGRVFIDLGMSRLILITWTTHDLISRKIPPY